MAEYKTKEEVLETIGEERSLIRTTKTRQKKWIGYTLRGQSLLKTEIEGKYQEKIKRKTKTNDAGLDDFRRI